MNVIKVRITNKYGKELIYPMCQKAELFCSIAGAKTLTRSNIESIKALGFDVDVVPEVTSL
jgi:hypothetical protein